VIVVLVKYIREAATSYCP